VHALLVESVEVRPDWIEARVRVSQERFVRTTGFPELTSRASGLLPGLARHHCENGVDLPLLEEFADTETPHVLEHVTLELMAMAGSPRSLKGETSWDFSADGHGVFRVRLAYDDDLVALGALRLGVEVVDYLLTLAEKPEVHVRVAQLRAARRVRG
jgi:hypothetical protein